MSYATSNPPRKILSGGIDNSQTPQNVWLYSSTDADTSVYAAGYFTNGIELGMAIGDIVFYYKTDTKALYVHVVNAGTTDATLALSSTSIPLAD